jgi:hypothetical protein
MLSTATTAATSPLPLLTESETLNIAHATNTHSPLLITPPPPPTTFESNVLDYLSLSLTLSHFLSSHFWI